MNEHRIFPLSINDIEILRNISILTFRQAFEEYNTPENMAHYIEHNLSIEQLSFEISQKHSAFYGISNNEGLMGYLKLNYPISNKLDGLEIERIYILNAFQRKGLGENLLSFSINKCKEYKLSSIWLGVWEHNKKAIQFYAKNGFIEYGEHNFLLGDDIQRDILMRKNL